MGPQWLLPSAPLKLTQQLPVWDTKSVCVDMHCRNVYPRLEYNAQKALHRRSSLRRYQGSNLGFGNDIIRIPSDNHYTIAPRGL